MGQKGAEIGAKRGRNGVKRGRNGAARQLGRSAPRRHSNAPSVPTATARVQMDRSAGQSAPKAGRRAALPLATLPCPGGARRGLKSRLTSGKPTSRLTPPGRQTIGAGFAVATNERAAWPGRRRRAPEAEGAGGKMAPTSKSERAGPGAKRGPAGAAGGTSAGQGSRGRREHIVRQLERVRVSEG